MKKICSRAIARLNSKREENHNSNQLAGWTQKIQENKEVTVSWTTTGWGILGRLHLWIVRQSASNSIDYCAESPISPVHFMSSMSEHAGSRVDVAPQDEDHDNDANDIESTRSGIFWPEDRNQIPIDCWDFNDDCHGASSSMDDCQDFFRSSSVPNSPYSGNYCNNNSNNDYDDDDYDDDGTTEINVASIIRTPISSFPTMASFELQWRLRYNPVITNNKPWQRAFPDIFDVRLDEENLLTYNAEHVNQWRVDKSNYAVACTVLHFSEAFVHVKVMIPKVKHDATILEVTLHSRSDKDLLFNDGTTRHDAADESGNRCGLCAQHDALG
ncbi:hypothetical protein BDF22DRAFT_742493 [Syncephalis plumigaleata]|nr:hypothetical protein BDF22DRAFT_742493 [Syncephalis plumigaleata]